MGIKNDIKDDGLHFYKFDSGCFGGSCMLWQ